MNNSVDLGLFLSASRFGKFPWGKLIWASKSNSSILGLLNQDVDLDESIKKPQVDMGLVTFFSSSSLRNGFPKCSFV